MIVNRTETTEIIDNLCDGDEETEENKVDEE
jgi:hypothetical protein